MSECEVSVICIVYNQEKYISKMLDSILEQKTSFPYEVIIHDDCSTDKTQSIALSYAEKYPEKIKLFFEEVNQYSKGEDSFRFRMVTKASGKYIAMCEGDDFWLDDEKLLLQYNALEAHPECDLCACWGSTTTEDGREISQIRPCTESRILGAEEVIMGGGQYLVTAGLFFRKSMYDNEMNFEKIIPLDYVMQIRGALRGGIFYIDRKMAAYRRNSVGSWSENVLKNKANLRKQWSKEKQFLYVLDEETDGKYHNAIAERLKAYISFFEQLSERKEAVTEMMRSLRGSVYLWGMGRRGEEFEEFCAAEKLRLDGICDLSDENVDKVTLYGNRVFSAAEVMKCADNILASNDFAYNDLKQSAFKGRLLNLQIFMPYG